MAFDFALILLISTALFGLVWAFDRAFLYRKRKQRAEAAGKDYSDPWPVDWARSLFPVVLLVLVLRSFVAEPFRIPSSSMMPTLKVGDFILVNKFTYGLRLPVFHTKVLPLGEPKRGDIVVFRPPWSPNQDWIKRIVGLPGDKVVVRGEKVYVNGKLVQADPIGPYAGKISDNHDLAVMQRDGEVLDENLDGVHHHIIETPKYHVAPNVPNPLNPVIVPQHCYFVMGDNRDDSDDSRYHGCVPEKDLVGKAFFIWFSLHSYKRIGTVLH
jgi:signal peptidase I